MFQTVVFIFTMFNFLAAVKEGWGSISIIVLLIRDGTWVFCLSVFTYLPSWIGDTRVRFSTSSYCSLTIYAGQLGLFLRDSYHSLNILYL